MPCLLALPIPLPYLYELPIHLWSFFSPQPRFSFLLANLFRFFRFSFNVSSVSHTDSYSFPLLACSAAGLRACACAADQATYTISNMEAREVETTQISGNVWPQLVLFALGTFFVVSITQVPHSTSLARGSMASVTTKRRRGVSLCLLSGAAK